MNGLTIKMLYLFRVASVNKRKHFVLKYTLIFLHQSIGQSIRINKKLLAFLYIL